MRTAAAGQARSGVVSFETSAIELRGVDVVADRSGALYVPAERTLVVADLHLEKGSAFAARGFMLPPYDTRETLARLAAVIGRYAPAHVVALGDSLHDRGAERRIGEMEIAELRRLQAGREWHWITGNHDPVIGPGVGGQVAGQLSLGGLELRHEPSSGAVVGEIAAHLHPAARVVLSRVGLRRPCFVSDAHRLVLPAFGAFTGGLNVLDVAFAGLFGEAGFAVRLIGRDGVYPVARACLLPD